MITLKRLITKQLHQNRTHVTKRSYQTEGLAARHHSYGNPLDVLK